MKRGFTLIELLVVIAIIAILAAILFPVFAKAREKARQTNCLSNQKQIVVAVQMWTQDNNELLPPASGWTTSVGLSGKVLTCLDASGLTNAYLYNNKYAGQTLSSATQLQTADLALLTCDGAHTATVATGVYAATLVNMLYTSTDPAPRHNNSLIAGWVDGHVSLVAAAPAAELAGLPFAMPLYISQPTAATATASSYFNAQTWALPSNVINGGPFAAGTTLAGGALADGTVYTSSFTWPAIANTQTCWCNFAGADGLGVNQEWIQVDLGAAYTVVGFHLWNLDYNGGLYNGPPGAGQGPIGGTGVMAGTITAGTTATPTTVVYSATAGSPFPAAPDTTTYTGATYMFTAPTSARYIMLNCATNEDGLSGSAGQCYVGISAISLIRE